MIFHLLGSRSKERVHRVHPDVIIRQTEDLLNVVPVPGGGTLGISGWGCAAGTLEPQPIPEIVQLNFATLLK